MKEENTVYDDTTLMKRNTHTVAEDTLCSLSHCISRKTHTLTIYNIYICTRNTYSLCTHDSKIFEHQSNRYNDTLNVKRS